MLKLEEKHITTHHNPSQLNMAASRSKRPKYMDAKTAHWQEINFPIKDWHSGRSSENMRIPYRADDRSPFMVDFLVNPNSPSKYDSFFSMILSMIAIRRGCASRALRTPRCAACWMRTDTNQEALAVQMVEAQRHFEEM